jgi:hypothetical protein
VYFHSFAIIFPWRKVIPFVWINLNPLCLKLFVPSQVKIGPMVLEKKIFKWPNPIFTFLWFSLLWRGPGPLFEKKIESPPPKDNLYKVWLNLACWFWRRFLIFLVYFYFFAIISPWRRAFVFIWTILNSLHPRMICANWSSGSGEEVKNVKVYRQTDGRTTGDQNSSLKLSSQVS